jgi:hypothetical protein
MEYAVVYATRKSYDVVRYDGGGKAWFVCFCSHFKTFSLRARIRRYE